MPVTQSLAEQGEAIEGIGAASRRPGYLMILRGTPQHNHTSLRGRVQSALTSARTWLSPILPDVLVHDRAGPSSRSVPGALQKYVRPQQPCATLPYSPASRDGGERLGLAKDCLEK